MKSSNGIQFVSRPRYRWLSFLFKLPHPLGPRGGKPAYNSIRKRDHHRIKRHIFRNNKNWKHQHKARPTHKKSRTSFPPQKSPLCWNCFSITRYLSLSDWKYPFSIWLWMTGTMISHSSFIWICNDTLRRNRTAREKRKRPVPADPLVRKLPASACRFNRRVWPCGQN